MSPCSRYEVFSSTTEETLRMHSFVRISVAFFYFCLFHLLRRASASEKATLGQGLLDRIYLKSQSEIANRSRLRNSSWCSINGQADTLNTRELSYAPISVYSIDSQTKLYWSWWTPATTFLPYSQKVRRLNLITPPPDLAHHFGNR